MQLRVIEKYIRCESKHFNRRFNYAKGIAGLSNMLFHKLILLYNIFHILLGKKIVVK